MLTDLAALVGRWEEVEESGEATSWGLSEGSVEIHGGGGDRLESLPLGSSLGGAFGGEDCLPPEGSSPQTFFDSNSSFVVGLCLDSS